MATATKKSDNLFENVIGFYLDQFEKLGPKVKEGLEDWFDFYGKAWEQYFKLQNDFFGQFGSNKDSSAEFSKQSKSFVQSAFNAQREFATSAIDIAVKNAKAFSGKAKKRPAGKRATARK